MEKNPSCFLLVLYDLVATVPAVQSPFYNVVVPTLQDSSESGNHSQIFLITSHTSNPLIYGISPIDSGYSVDNLAPGMVTALQGIFNGSDSSILLSWTPPVDEDVKQYSEPISESWLIEW
jgi:hypothetical protein